MNSYKLSDIYVGLAESFTVTVTEEMLDSFRATSGDVNPLHKDEQYAKARGYKGKVAFGMLTASFYSTLAGVYLPGEHCLLHEVSVRFKSPVFIGDTLTLKGKVVNVSETFRRIEIKAKAVNQDGKTVNSAMIIAGLID